MTDTVIATRREQEAELYGSGLSADEIGAEFGVSGATVRRDLREMGVPLYRRGPARGARRIVFTADEITERRSRVAEFAALGKTDHEIGRLLGVSKTTVANDRRVLGIAPRPPGQPPKSPLPDERPCEICGTIFRPTRAHVKAGGGRFCGKPECVAQDPKRREASRRFVGSLNASRAERITALKAEGDLLTRDEVASELGVTPSSVDHYFRQGYLASLRVEDLPGQPTKLVRRQDLERFKREWRMDGDRTRQTIRARWLEPDFVVRVYRGSGKLDRDAAEHRQSVEREAILVRHDVKLRAQLFGPRRGRRKGLSGPPAYHLEWLEQFEFWREAHRQQYEERRRLELLAPGEGPPTVSDACLAVAEADFEEHRERWPDYPHAPGDEHALHPQWQKAAVDKVRKAVKALQSPATEIP